MKKKDFIRIINEEISRFDFLDNDQYLKEQEVFELLETEQFQKQFIVDSITKMGEKIQLVDSDASVHNNPDMNDPSSQDNKNLDYHVDLSYKQDSSNEPINFTLTFYGNNNIEVSLFTSEGDEVNFVAFENAPEKIQKLFIKSYVEPIVERQIDTGTSDFQERLPQYNSY